MLASGIPLHVQQSAHSNQSVDLLFSEELGGSFLSLFILFIDCWLLWIEAFLVTLYLQSFPRYYSASALSRTSRAKQIFWHFLYSTCYLLRGGQENRRGTAIEHTQLTLSTSYSYLSWSIKPQTTKFSHKVDKIKVVSISSKEEKKKKKR